MLAGLRHSINLVGRGLRMQLVDRCSMNDLCSSHSRARLLAQPACQPTCLSEGSSKKNRETLNIERCAVFNSKPGSQHN